jgi:hypothetical protein
LNRRLIFVSLAFALVGACSSCSDEGTGAPPVDPADVDGDASDVGTDGDDADDVVIRPDAPPDVTSGDGGTDPGGDCDPFAQDCPADGETLRQCSVVGGVPHCVDQNPLQIPEDAACEGGDCQPGLTCIDWPGDRGQVCTKMCDRAEGASGCSADSACTSWLSGNPAVGLCEPTPTICDIYEQNCPTGEACTFGRHPVTNEPIFVCAEAGAKVAGEACSGDQGRCVPGLVCINVESVSTCHEICLVDTEDCPTGQTCSGVSTTWSVHFCR